MFYNIICVQISCTSIYYIDGGLFVTGGDILKKSELGTIDLLSGLRGSCGPPETVHGSMVFRNGELLKEAEKR